MSPKKGNCYHSRSKIIDSRPKAPLKNGPLRHFGRLTYRRHECLKCGHRWTTYEVVEETLFAASKALDTLTTIDKLLSGEIIKPGNGRKPKEHS